LNGNAPNATLALSGTVRERNQLKSNAMTPKLKKLSDQVIVITGASSGIGLVTARMAAKKGARLVLAARSDDALRQLTEEIEKDGGQAIHVVADVSNQHDIHRIAQAAVDRFGGFDTWVNNSGVSIYGKIEEVPIEDMRKLFETNVWGLIYGSLEAAKHLKQKGGAIINIGSILSESTAILQTIYSASKHAVKGFTDGLRMELEMDEAPIVVTLVKPAAIDTPYPLHAKNFMDREAQHAPPAYAPETVARAILHCAENPEREVTVGGGGRAITAMNHWVPRLLDKFMENVFVKQEKAEYPPQPLDQNGLDRPVGALEERGNYPGHTRESSYYTSASLHPLATAAIIGAGVAITAALLGSSKNSNSARRPKHVTTTYPDGTREVR
jgi:short-subunit dehydrogenase